MRAVLSIACAILMASAVGVGAARGQAANACGCYQDDAGVCRCTKKSKCGCPEECEPMGCQARRERQAEKEANAALKRIAAEEKKKSAAAARASKRKRPRPEEKLPPDPVGDAAAAAARKAL